MRLSLIVIAYAVLLILHECATTPAPSFKPSKTPTTSPSANPTSPPTTRPSGPTVANPTKQPTKRPTCAPTYTAKPSSPTVLPTRAPIPNGDTLVVFDYTGELQNFTVPSGVSSITVTLVGASGGDNVLREGASPWNLGGRGALITSTLFVNPGEVYHIHVGGAGKTGRDAGGFNGGGGSWGVAIYVASGGGATDFRAYPYGIDERMMVAGGGGGTGGNCGDDYGGGGGYPNGLSGVGCYPPGEGGAQTSGGFAGDNIRSPYYCTAASRGEFYQGGGGCGNSAQTLGYGGGGGGGYYGGGGALAGGGGGGSSYSAFPVLEAINNTRAGNGAAWIQCHFGSSAPTLLPTTTPSALPTTLPSQDPTLFPTATPTAMPTEEPTAAPTLTPTVRPTTTSPSGIPSLVPSATPTFTPSAGPTMEPTDAGTQVSFDGAQFVNGVTATEFLANHVILESWKATVALSCDREKADLLRVEVLSVEDVTARRNLLVDETRLFTETIAKVNFQVSYTQQVYDSASTAAVSAPKLKANYEHSVQVQTFNANFATEVQKRTTDSQEIIDTVQPSVVVLEPTYQVIETTSSPSYTPTTSPRPTVSPSTRKKHNFLFIFDFCLTNQIFILK